MKDCDFFFGISEYESVKDDLIKHNSLPCSKDYSNKLVGELK